MLYPHDGMVWIFAPLHLCMKIPLANTKIPAFAGMTDRVFIVIGQGLRSPRVHDVRLV
jgi:hypothetical protein